MKIAEKFKVSQNALHVESDAGLTNLAEQNFLNQSHKFLENHS